MTIKEIIEYVLHTPHNTNKVILTEMLRRLIVDNGGIDPEIPTPPVDPDTPSGVDVVYDGGTEK